MVVLTMAYEIRCDDHGYPIQKNPLSSRSSNPQICEKVSEQDIEYITTSKLFYFLYRLLRHRFHTLSSVRQNNRVRH